MNKIIEIYRLFQNDRSQSKQFYWEMIEKLYSFSKYYVI